MKKKTFARKKVTRNNNKLLIATILTLITFTIPTLLELYNPTGHSTYTTTDTILGTTAAPEIPTVNSPQNQSSARSASKFYNLTLSDVDGDTLNITILVGTTTNPTRAITHNASIASGATVAYNWTRPPAGLVFPNDANLTGYWNFDKNASDFSTYGRNGTGNGNAFINVTGGVLAGAGQFDGSGDYYSTIAASNFFAADASTISLWAKPTGTSPSVANVYSGAALAAESSGYMGLYRATIGGQDRIWAYNYDVTEDRTGATYTNNEWAHFVLVHSGGQLYLYKNGVLASNVSSDNTGSLGGTMRVGWGYSSAVEFSGSLDDVAFWNRALNATEIANLYTLQSTTYYWKAIIEDQTALTTTGVYQTTIQNNAPAVPTMNSPANNTGSTGTTISFNVTVTDSDGDPLNVTIFSSNSTSMNKTIAFFKDVAGGSHNYTWASPTIDMAFANDANLTGYWNLNKNGTDATPNSRNGTLAGNAYINASGGYIAGGITVDGSSDYLNIDYASSNFFTNTTATFSIWARPTGASPVVAQSYNGVGLLGETLGYIGIYRATIGGQDRIWAYNYDTNEDRIGATYTNNQWAHFVMVHNSSTLTYYKDGALIGTTPSGDTGSLGSIFRIGSANSGKDFNGTLDEAALWNRALAPEEVNTLYKLGNGIYYWKAEVDDGLATNTTGIAAYTLDNITPTNITHTNPTLPSGTTTTATTYYINITFTDMAPNNCLLDDGTTNTTMTRNGTNCYINKSITSDGTVAYKVWVNDTLGNIASSTTRNITFDTTTPAINYSAPTPTTGTNTSTTTIVVNITASDTSLDTITVRLYNGSNLYRTNMSTTSPFFINYTGLSDGTYSYNATANDTAGNTNTTSTRTITIDTINPSVALFSPQNNTILTSSSIFFNTSVTDRAVHNVTLFINETANMTDTSGTNGSTPFTIFFADGKYSWHVLLYDSAGNSNQTGTRYFTVDTTPPTASEAATNTTTGIPRDIITFTITVNDATTTVNKSILNLQYYKNTTSTSYSMTITNNTAMFSWNTSNHPTGTYLASYVVNDSAGHNRNLTNEHAIVLSRTNATVLRNASVNLTTGTATTFNTTGNALIIITTRTNITNASIIIITYTNNTENTTPSNKTSLGRTVHVILDNETNLNITTAFLNATYSDSDVTAAGLNESSLQFYKWNTTLNNWTTLTSTGVDTTNNIVWANVTSFSIYGIFGNATINGSGSSGADSGSTGGSTGGGSGSSHTISSNTTTTTPAANATTPTTSEQQPVSSTETELSRENRTFRALEERPTILKDEHLESALKRLSFYIIAGFVMLFAGIFTILIFMKKR